MDFVETLLDIIVEFGGQILGFFSAFIEAVTNHMDSGAAFIAVMLIIIIWIKIKKMV